MTPDDRVTMYCRSCKFSTTDYWQDLPIKCPQCHRALIVEAEEGHNTALIAISAIAFAVFIIAAIFGGA